MRLLLLLLAVLTTSPAIEVLDRCELDYRRCMFECIQKYPLDKDKRSGCETRCKLNKGWCKTGKAVDKLTKELKDFLEGFSGER